MTSNTRWTPEMELELIKQVSQRKSSAEIGVYFEKSENAIELRLKKIIYENISSGKKTFEEIGNLLNLMPDKVSQYYYSYKDFREKHGVTTNSNPNKNIVDIDNANDINNINNINNINIAKQYEQNGGSNISNDSQTLGRFEKKLHKLELENKVMALIVENKDLTHKLNKLIKNGRVDGNVKKIIKNIRESS